LKALLVKTDGTNSLALDEDQKMVWVALLTRGGWGSEDAGSKESWQACGGRFRDRQMLPGVQLSRPAVLSVLAQIDVARFHESSSTSRAVKYVILYLLYGG
jgi:hypothetical protein